VQRIATTDRTVAPFLFDVTGSLSLPAGPLQTFGTTALGVQGALVLCLVGVQAFASRTLGHRVPRVIWQKMQVEVFPQ